jgi:hypothetical protein
MKTSLIKVGEEYAYGESLSAAGSIMRVKALAVRPEPGGWRTDRPRPRVLIEALDEKKVGYPWDREKLTWDADGCERIAKQSEESHRVAIVAKVTVQSIKKLWSELTELELARYAGKMAASDERLQVIAALENRGVHKVLVQVYSHYSGEGLHVKLEGPLEEISKLWQTHSHALPMVGVPLLVEGEEG